jgi:hypothetical protein
MIFGIIPSSAVSTLSIGNKEFSTVGENATIDFYLDVVPDGLVGGIYLVHLEDDSIASISDVKFPPWVLLKANSSNLQNDVWLKVFAQPPILNGTTNVYLGSVTVTAHKKGSTPITIQLSDPTDIRNLKYWFEDMKGNIINIKVIPGMITVKGTNTDSVSTTAPSSGLITENPSVSRTLPLSPTVISTRSTIVPPAGSTPFSPSVPTTVLPSTPEKTGLSLPLILIGGILGAVCYFRRSKKN